MNRLDDYLFAEQPSCDLEEYEEGTCMHCYYQDDCEVYAALDEAGGRSMKSLYEYIDSINFEKQIKRSAKILGCNDYILQQVVFGYLQDAWEAIQEVEK